MVDKREVTILAFAVVILVVSLIASQPASQAGRTLTSIAHMMLPDRYHDYPELLRALDEYAPDSITPEADKRSMKVVEDTIRAYDLDKEGTLRRINALGTDSVHPFVLDPGTKTVVAHGDLPERVGAESVLFTEGSDRDPDSVLFELLNGGEGTGAWLEYLLFDVNLSTDQIKRSWLVLHDGLIFGAGHFYSAELRVRHEVDKAIFMYEYDKDLALDYISSRAEEPYPYYVVVINIKSAEVLAHGAFPDETVGTKVSWSRKGLTDLGYGDAFWLLVKNKNPVTGLIDQKRVWTVAHDGHYFASGYYYYVEDKSMFVVDRAVEAYRELGRDAAFAQINSLESVDPSHPFVLDAASWTVAAHGAFPDLVGMPSGIIVTDENIADLQANSTTWVHHLFENPDTGETEHKRTYLRLHDGYVFGSGFYYMAFGVLADD